MSLRNLGPDSSAPLIPDTVHIDGTITPETWEARGTISPIIISSFIFSKIMAETEVHDSDSYDNIEIENVTITSESPMTDLDMNIAATIHEHERKLLNLSISFISMGIISSIFLICSLSYIAFRGLASIDIMGPIILGITLISISFIQFRENEKNID